MGRKVKLSDGATLTGLFMSHQGMAREPYYIFRVKGDRSYMKITSEAPNGYRMTEGDKLNIGIEKEKDDNTDEDISKEEEIHYFGFVDEVKDYEHASLVTADETIIKQLTEEIIQSDALKWNGYSKHKKMKNVADSGDGYCLFLIFSDKTTVKVNGYNACPDGFKAFFSNVRDIFNEHADYSRYAITELSEENCVRMIVEFYDGIGRKNDFKADIYSDGEKGITEFNVRIKDADGAYFEKGTDLSISKEVSRDSFSYGRLIKVLRENNVESWNGIQKTNAWDNKYVNILIVDNDGKKLEVNGNTLPNGYDKVRKAFAEALFEFYDNLI